MKTKLVLMGIVALLVLNLSSCIVVTTPHRGYYRGAHGAYHGHHSHGGHHGSHGYYRR